MHKKSAIPVVLMILVLAIGLRVWGAKWGLPTSLHYFSYHPDETTVLLSAMKVNPFAGQLDPGFYNYGSLYIFLVSIAAILSTMTGAINIASGDIFSNIGEFAKLYMAGRTVSLILGIATVWLVYMLGKRAYGRGTGILAALFMAVMPIHIMDSKFLAVDVPATFFVVLALLFAMRITDGCRLRDYLLAGLFAGLAAGTKYNAGLVVLAPVVAHLAAPEDKLNAKPLGTLIMMAAGFLIGTPGALLNHETFLRDFSFEVLHAKTGHGLVFTGTGNGFAYHFMHSLWPAMGLPLLVLASIGLLYAVRKRTPADLAFLAFTVAYYVVIGAASVRFARYTIPLLPVLALLAARVSVDLFQRLRAGKTVSRSLGHVVAIMLAGVTLYTLAYSVSIDRMFSATDTRDRAAEWISRSIPKGTTIGFPTAPWFYTPPIDPYFGLPNPDDRFERTKECSNYMLAVSQDNEWDVNIVKREMPGYVIMSELEYEDRVRIHDAAASKYFDLLKQDYRLTNRFVDMPSLFGWRIPLVRELPHDMSYVSPTILIYTRKAG